MDTSHIVLMCILIFFWLWSLPLLLVMTIFMAPAAWCVLALSTSLSIYLQWRHHGRIFVRHPIRQWLSRIPWHEWFPCNVLRFDKKSVVAVHPHGLLCCGAVAGIHLVPESETVLCVAPVLFYVPVIGWLLRLIGCIPARLAEMRGALQGGHTLLVIPGGVPELVLAETGDDRRRFRRHGFLRLARDMQVPVFTVFVRGECSLFHIPKAPCLQRRVWWSWRLNVPLVVPVFLGWYGTWLPKRVPLCLTPKKIEDIAVYDATLYSLMNPKL